MLTALINRLTEYLKIKAEQIKLQVIGHVAKLLSHVIVFSLLAFLGLFLVFFVSFAMGSLLNEVFASSYLGHLTIAGVYFLLILILALLSKTGRVQGWLEQLILKVSDQIEEDEDE
ncbi:MAG: hypothetical protein RIF46_01660 [Cyclobacteriaceae bacterium]